SRISTTRGITSGSYRIPPRTASSASSSCGHGFIGYHPRRERRKSLGLPWSSLVSPAPSGALSVAGPSRSAVGGSPPPPPGSAPAPPGRALAASVGPDSCCGRCPVGGLLRPGTPPGGPGPAGTEIQRL